MRVFYVRCSTIEQNEARQLKMAEEQNAEKVFVDKASGKNTDRAAFKEMMAFVRAGDTVVVESISRIARNTRDLLSIVSELTEKGVEFVSLKENIDTTAPQGRFMLTVFGALAELERENILERQRERIEIAKSEGKYKGRKPIDYDEAQMKALEAYKSDDVFQQRHRQRHDDEHHRIIPERAGKRAEERMIEFRKNKQQHRTEAVERQAGAEQEAGVQPFALRVRAGEEAAEKQFQHPTADTAEEE